MQKQSGFSLVELMVAMTVTLIVTAAIYGLLTSGSAAFRREPEIADRQQNIRIAMDLIARDVFNAGASLPRFAQVFTLQDPDGTCAAGLNGCGAPGALGATAAAARGNGGDPSTNSDVLEIVTTSENCPYRSACNVTLTPGAFVNTVPTREPVLDCMRPPGFALLADHENFTIQPIVDAVDGDYCSPGGVNGQVTLGDPIGSWNTLPGSGANIINPFVHTARVVRYTIAPSTDPIDTAPALWRSTQGRYLSDASATADPGDSPSPWELVARGIEDLQIEYRAGAAGPWENQPPPSAVDDWDTVVREVRITLSARASAPGGSIQGATTAEGGPDAIRGQLTTVVAPRAALNDLQMGGQIQ